MRRYFPRLAAPVVTVVSDPSIREAFRGRCARSPACASSDAAGIAHQRMLASGLPQRNAFTPRLRTAVWFDARRDRDGPFELGSPHDRALRGERGHRRGRFFRFPSFTWPILPLAPAIVIVVG